MNNDEAASALNGKVAIVTGAAQGLGLSIAELLARRGAAVTIADIQQEKATTSARDLRQKGLSVDAARLDVAGRAVGAADRDWLVERREQVLCAQLVVERHAPRRARILRHQRSAS